jgi:hypothetical protein
MKHMPQNKTLNVSSSLQLMNTKAHSRMKTRALEVNHCSEKELNEMVLDGRRKYEVTKYYQRI